MTYFTEKGGQTACSFYSCHVSILPSHYSININVLMLQLLCILWSVVINAVYFGFICVFLTQNAYSFCLIDDHYLSFKTVHYDGAIHFFQRVLSPSTCGGMALMVAA